ncbi:MAG: SBBP repeat-containing protein, partial [FCB group bacterium]
MKLFILLYISTTLIALPLLTAMGGQECVNEYKSLSPVFIENKGQWDAEVKYLAKLKGMYCWITAKGIVCDIYNKERIDNKSVLERIGIGYNLLENNSKYDFNDNPKEEIINRNILKMEFIGQDDKFIYDPKYKQESYYNYFIGNDSSKWSSFVPLYKEIVVKNIYNGIDWHYYFDNNRLRFDIIVNTGADISQIKLLCTGQDEMSINNDGELSLKAGEHEIELNNIYAFQVINGMKQKINCKLEISGKNLVKINAENYNKDVALIIDPLIYSTYIGDDDEDEGHAIVADSGGNAYLTGYTGSLKYPVTAGAFQTTYGGGDYDCFITKLNANGTAISFTTFIGGDTTDCGYGIALDRSGNIYITGQTASKNYPITSNAFQRSYAGGAYDCFVTKMNPSGSALIYSTFIGGSGDDFSRGLALD